MSTIVLYLLGRSSQVISVLISLVLVSGDVYFHNCFFFGGGGNSPLPPVYCRELFVFTLVKVFFPIYMIRLFF